MHIYSAKVSTNCLIQFIISLQRLVKCYVLIPWSMYYYRRMRSLRLILMARLTDMNRNIRWKNYCRQNWSQPRSLICFKFTYVCEGLKNRSTIKVKKLLETVLGVNVVSEWGEQYFIINDKRAATNVSNVSKTANMFFFETKDLEKKAQV